MIHPARIRSLRITGITLGVAIGFIAACQRSEPPPNVAAPPAAAPAQPALAFHVTRIDLGTSVGPDKKVASPVVAFKPDDTIYASVMSEGTAASVALKARWTFEDGQLVNESTQMISPNGPAATEFHIAKPDGWPEGKYKLEVAANGKLAGSADFSVGPPG
jgi:hypothetical protein